jgi:hypothetical protein
MDLELNMFGQDVRSTNRPNKKIGSNCDINSRECPSLQFPHKGRRVQRSELLVRTRVTVDRKLDVSTCKLTFQEAHYSDSQGPGDMRFTTI